MDLEERTRAFFAAIRSGPAPAILDFLAEDALFEVIDLLPAIGVPKVDAMVRRAYATTSPVDVRLVALKIKRNVAFAGWKAKGNIPGGGPGDMEGLAVVHWNRDGKISRLDIHLGPEAAGRLQP